SRASAEPVPRSHQPAEERLGPRVVEEGYRLGLAASGEKGTDLAEDDFGDEGQVEPPRLAKGHPVQMRQFVRRAREIVGVAWQRGGIGEEEPRVEAARPAGRRDRAEDEGER